MGHIFNFKNFVENTKNIEDQRHHGFNLIRQVNGNEISKFIMQRKMEAFTKREIGIINNIFDNSFELEEGQLVYKVKGGEWGIITKFADEWFTMTVKTRVYSKYSVTYRYFIIDSISGFEEFKNVLKEI